MHFVPPWMRYFSTIEGSVGGKRNCKFVRHACEADQQLGGGIMLADV
jgi:hypothetical protein